MDKIIPNTTQVPNMVLDDLLPCLKDVELRVVLVVVRQTLGWIEDPETGRRKERDWISRSQIMQKAGRGHASVSSAIETLVRAKIIEARDTHGNLLASGKERSGNKIFYRLNLEARRSSLPVHKPARTVQKPVQKIDRPPRPVQNLDVQNLDTTKETQNTKEEAKAAKLPTNSLLREFKEICMATRNELPRFTRFKDGHLMKMALKHLSEGQIRMLFVWFLREKRNMQATIGAALCRSVIDEFIRASQREYGFYRKLEGWHRQYSLKPLETDGLPSMAERLTALKRNLFGGFASDGDRALLRESAGAQSP